MPSTEEKEEEGGEEEIIILGVTRLLGVLRMWSPDHSAPQLLAWAACFPPSISGSETMGPWRTWSPEPKNHHPVSPVVSF